MIHPRIIPCFFVVATPRRLSIASVAPKNGRWHECNDIQVFYSSLVVAGARLSSSSSQGQSRSSVLLSPMCRSPPSNLAYKQQWMLYLPIYFWLVLGGHNVQSIVRLQLQLQVVGVLAHEVVSSHSPGTHTLYSGRIRSTLVCGCFPHRTLNVTAVRDCSLSSIVSFLMFPRQALADELCLYAYRS